MNEQLHNLFVNITNKFFAFIPSFLVGVILVVIGWVLAWIVKRMVIQMLILLKFDRVLTRFPWGRSFSKADVRYGMYSSLGNICFLIVFLLFLYYTLLNWGLGFISELLREGILFFPRLIAAAVILGIGWMIAAWASRSLNKFLYQEQIPNSVLISYYVKVTLIILFSAIAVAELDIAREIVIIGFSVTFITLGVIAVILIILQGRRPLDSRGNTPDLPETQGPDDRDDKARG